MWFSYRLRIWRWRLVGAVVLSKVEQGRFDPTVLQAWLGETLTREDDRALFELL